MKDTKTWNTSTYNGFRSQFSIIARPALMMNLMVFHLWHPRPKTSSFYNQKKLEENRVRIFKSFEDFEKNRNHPIPLTDLSIADKNVLYFGKVNTDAFNCLRGIFPLLGNVKCVSEYDFVNLDNLMIRPEFSEMLSIEKINLIIFPNVYGNPARLELYKWCKENKIPFLCYERGALPDSWFFDSYGCNADSLAYQSIDYMRPMAVDTYYKVKKYIRGCLHDFEPLEVQGNRKGAEAFLSQQNILGRKVLFVPLQRPSDTVIQHYIGQIESYENFIKIIDRLAENLKYYGWVTVVKKHPLETKRPNLSHVVFASDDAHFLDLLESCDAVALINSGVGVYSMMMEKPCYIFGEAFYAVENINYSVTANEYSDELAISRLAQKIVRDEITVNKDKMYKFIDFLIHDFYSFGIPQTKRRKEPDGSLRTITTGIDFYDLKFLGKQFYTYSPLSRKPIARTAPLFEKYALDIHNKRIGVTQSKSEKPSLDVNSHPVPSTKQSVTSARFDRINQSFSMKKFSKFKKNPYLFFRDSKKPALRKLRVFFEK